MTDQTITSPHYVPALSAHQAERLLRLTASPHEEQPLFWRRGYYRSGDDRETRYLVNCSDFFVWGSADFEPVTDDTVDVLEASLADAARAIANPEWRGNEGFLLYCARTREQRPQGAYYPYLHSATWPLFDAAGRVRDVGPGNPRSRPKASASGAEKRTRHSPEYIIDCPMPGVPFAPDPLERDALLAAIECFGFDNCDQVRWVVDDEDVLRLFVVAYDRPVAWTATTVEVTCSNLDRLLDLAASADDSKASCWDPEAFVVTDPPDAGS